MSIEDLKNFWNITENYILEKLLMSQIFKKFGGFYNELVYLTSTPIEFPAAFFNKKSNLRKSDEELDKDEQTKVVFEMKFSPKIPEFIQIRIIANRKTPWINFLFPSPEKKERELRDVFVEKLLKRQNSHPDMSTTFSSESMKTNNNKNNNNNNNNNTPQSPHSDPDIRRNKKKHPEKIIESAPPVLILHFHGGGFVAQSSQSHVGYLR
jgi:hypothetical protein